MKRYLSTWRKAFIPMPGASIIGEISERLLQAQKRSKDLSVDKSSEADIKRAADDKGGYTALLVRKVLTHPMQECEEKAVYKLGALIQFMDDIFDIYEDSRNDVCSLAYPTPRIDRLSIDYRRCLQETLALFYRLPYERRYIEKFSYLLVLLVSRTFVCLDRLEKLAKKSGDFNPRCFDRKSLICDMEKPANLLKSLYYTINYSYRLY